MAPASASAQALMTFHTCINAGAIATEQPVWGQAALVSPNSAASSS